MNAATSHRTGRDGTLRCQRAVVIWLAVAAIVLAAIFPPFQAGRQVSLGYAPIWSPPYPAEIDLLRLLIAWFLVGSVAGGLLLTLEEVVAFVSARRKALRPLAGIVLCGLVLAAVGPQQLGDKFRRYVSDGNTTERSGALTTYLDGIRARFPGAKVSDQNPSAVLDYLGKGRYRASSYMESPLIEGRLYFTTILKKEVSSAQGAPTWGIENFEVRKTPGGQTVSLHPRLNLNLDQEYNFDYGLYGRVMTEQPVTDAEQMIADGLRTGKPVRLESLAVAIRKLTPQFNYSDGGTVRRFAAQNPHLGLERLTYDMPASAPTPSTNPDQSLPPAAEEPRSPDTREKQ